MPEVLSRASRHKELDSRFRGKHWIPAFAGMTALNNNESLWDRGIFKLLNGSILEGKIEFILSGKKLEGVFILLRLKGKEKEWLLIKKKDEFADPKFKLKMALEK